MDCLDFKDHFLAFLSRLWKGSHRYFMKTKDWMHSWKLAFARKFRLKLYLLKYWKKKKKNPKNIDFNTVRQKFNFPLYNDKSFVNGMIDVAYVRF